MGATQRRAKILCTLGPASSDRETVGALIDAGMNAARLNFSHATHEEHTRAYAHVREEAKKRNVAVAVLADLQGPKIRVGKIPDPGFVLAKKSAVVISTDRSADVHQDGTTTHLTTGFGSLARDVGPGDQMLLDDGRLKLRVEEADGTAVRATVVRGGTLTSNKGINLPGVQLAVPSLTEKDREDLAFALDLGVDLVALSFVRRPDDIAVAREAMREHGRRVPLVAKIEKPEAITALDDIIDASEGIMVARGDLGVEMGPEVVPVLQKQAIELANDRGKLVITATQMLESMVRDAHPTRAEASDVANAVLDGTDALMLSAETATGAHPVQVVRTMDRIIRTTEKAPRHWEDAPGDLDLGHTANAIAHAAARASRSLTDTRAIIIYTGSGGTARLVSDYRPRVPIYAFTPELSTYQALALYWGVTPISFSPSGSEQSLFEQVDRACLDRGLLQRGDRVVITFGHPLGTGRSANLLKLHEIGESIG